MSNRFGAIFGGSLAVILLLIYALSAWPMILELLDSCPGIRCAPVLADKYLDGYRYVLTTVGGLVSALIIAQLSITMPGTMPRFRSLDDVNDKVRRASNVAVALYLLVWTSTGLAALVVGVMLYPNIIQTVGDVGTIWLGFAVGAGYAYFGLSPRDAANHSDGQA